MHSFSFEHLSNDAILDDIHYNELFISLSHCASTLSLWAPDLNQKSLVWNSDPTKPEDMSCVHWAMNRMSGWTYILYKYH